MVELHGGAASRCIEVHRAAWIELHDAACNAGPADRALLLQQCCMELQRPQSSAVGAASPNSHGGGGRTPRTEGFSPRGVG